MKICKARGVSVYKLEKSTGLSHGYVAKLDKSKPASDRLQKIADFFEIPIEQLLSNRNTDENNSVIKDVEVDEYIENILRIYWANSETVQAVQVSYTSKELNSQTHR